MTTDVPLWLRLPSSCPAREGAESMQSRQLHNESSCKHVVSGIGGMTAGSPSKICIIMHQR